MAHIALHFSAGLAAGTVAPLIPLARRLIRAETKSAILRTWICSAYALGAFACVPSLLRRLGVPAPAVTGWWMNLFVLHPLIDALESGGMLVGEILFAACFSLQYLVLLLTLRTLRNRSVSGPDIS